MHMLIQSKYVLYFITLIKKKYWLYYLEQDLVKFGTDMSKT